MPYVGRDERGNIITVSTQSSPQANEFIAAETDELRRYLAQLSPRSDDLARSDQDLIRVVEDIIDTLIEKNVIRFTDLPEAAQDKLVHRRSLRRSKVALDLLGSEEDQTIPPVIKL
jgi:hypothetical protein